MPIFDDPSKYKKRYAGVLIMATQDDNNYYLHFEHAKYALSKRDPDGEVTFKFNQAKLTGINKAMILILRETPIDPPEGCDAWWCFAVPYNKQSVERFQHLETG